MHKITTTAMNPILSSSSKILRPPDAFSLTQEDAADARRLFTPLSHHFSLFADHPASRSVLLGLSSLGETVR